MDERTEIEISGSEDNNVMAKRLIDEAVGNISGTYVLISKSCEHM